MVRVPDVPTDEVRTRFQNQKTKDTGPEMELRRLLHRQGLRYRVNYAVKGLPRRTVDIAFTKIRLAVFIDGCFWHGCPEHFVPPKKNAEWWLEKIAVNRRRDEDSNARLRELGWHVLRFWEHEQPLAELSVVLGRVGEIKENGEIVPD